MIAEKHLEGDLFRLNRLLASIGGWPLLRTRWSDRNFGLEKLYASIRGTFGLNTVFGVFLYPLPLDKHLNSVLYVGQKKTQKKCKCPV